MEAYNGDVESDWKITLWCIEIHTFIRRNELPDTLTKSSAINEIIPESHNKIHKSIVIRNVVEKSAKKWQRSWTQTTNCRNKK